jgi:hypothetical protein
VVTAVRLPDSRQRVQLSHWQSLSRSERDALAVRVPFAESGTIELPVLPTGLVAVPFGYALARLIRTERGCRA